MLYRINQWMAKRVQFTLLLFVCTAGFVQPSAADSADDLGVAIVDNTTRIVGGNASSRGQFPFVAGLVRNNSGFLADRQFCGASIINEKWLMTAAHCMYDTFGGRLTNDSFKAFVGITNMRTESPTEYVVANYFIHPQYNNNSLDIANDIALIELANVQPQPAVTLYNNDAAALAGFNATVLGWGATDYTDETNPAYPDELRHAVVPIITRDVCNSPISYAGDIGNTQICAGFAQGGVDSCVGDSGGPLITNIDGVTTQVGIVSYGRGCAEPQFYGVYTNVGSFVSWISDYTRINTVGTPRTLASSGGIGGGSAGQSTPSTGSGALWLLLWVMAGVCIRRRF